MPKIHAEKFTIPLVVVKKNKDTKFGEKKKKKIGNRKKKSACVYPRVQRFKL